MPANPIRRKNKPFLPQNELLHPRTLSRLRGYAKRRAAYSTMTALVLCVFIAHHLPEIRAWRTEQRRIKDRPVDKLRQRRHRAKLKLIARKAILQTKLEVCAAKIAQAEERIKKQQWQLRKHATANDGWITGWNAMPPLTEVELKALSYAKRYIEKYIDAVVKKQQWLESMAAQQSKPVAQPATIRL